MRKLNASRKRCSEDLSADSASELARSDERAPRKKSKGGGGEVGAAGRGAPAALAVLKPVLQVACLPEMDKVAQRANDFLPEVLRYPLSPYQAALVKPVQKPAHHALAVAAAQLSAAPAWRCSLALHETALWKRQTRRLLEDVAGLPEGLATLCIHLKGPSAAAPVPLDSPEALMEEDASQDEGASGVVDNIDAQQAQRLAALLQAIKRQKPMLRVIFTSSCDGLENARDLPQVQVLHTEQPEVLERAGQQRKVEKLCAGDAAVAVRDIHQLFEHHHVEYNNFADVFAHAERERVHRQVLSGDLGERQLIDFEHAAAKFVRRNISLEEKLASLLKPANAAAAVAKFLVDVTEQADYSTERLAGIPEAVEDFIEDVKNPLFGRGVLQGDHHSTLLLQGPPGTGKTSLAGAIARRLDMPLVAPKPSDLISKWLGETSQNIDQLFSAVANFAQQSKKRVVLFLDEVETLLAARLTGGSDNDGAEREVGRATSSLLQIVQGVRSHEIMPHIVLVCATNIPEALDKAAISRFVNVVQLGLPGREVLAKIYGIHLKGRTNTLLDTPQEAQHLAELAAASAGMSGRDVTQILDAAGRMACRRARAHKVEPAIAMEDVRAAIERQRQKEPGQSKPPFGLYL